MGDVKRFDAVNLKQRAEPAGCHAARVISAQEELFCSRSTSLDNAPRRALPAKKMISNCSAISASENLVYRVSESNLIGIFLLCCEKRKERGDRVV